MLRHGFHVRALSVCLAALVLCAPASALAQKSGESSLKITVTDPDGAFIRRARVTLKAGDSEARTIETNERGEATFARVSAGKSHVSVEAEGFKAHGPEEFSLAAGTNQTSVRLEVGGIVEEVDVAQDERERNLDPRGPAFSNVLTEDQLAALPDDPEEFEN